MEQRSQRPAFARAVASVYSASIGAAFLSLVNVVIISRSIGATGRGNVVLLTTIASLTAQITSMGVQQANANVAGREPERRAALGTNSVLLAAVLGLAGAGAVGGLALLFPRIAGDADRTLLWLSLASIPMLVLQTYLILLVQADYKFTLSNIVWLLPPVANVVVNGTCALFDVISTGSVVAVWIASQTATTLLLVWYIVRKLAGFGRPDARLARHMLGFGLKAHVNDVMMWGNYRLDQWIVGGVSGSRELGRYSVAVDWTEGLFFLPSALRTVQRPDLVRATPEGAAEQTARAFRAGAVLTVPLTLGLIVFAPLLTGLYGPDFEGGTDDLRVLALGGFGVLAMKLLGNALLAQRKPFLQSIAIGSSLVATIVLDVVLIPRYGGLGAAIASTVAYTIGALVITLVFTRALGGRPRDLIPRRDDVRWFVDLIRRSRRKPPPPQVEP